MSENILTWLKSFVLWYKDDQKGSILPFVAITFPVLLGMIGLGTDASLWMLNKRNLQISADAAVIAAGWELAQNSEDRMGDVALNEAMANGYDPTRNGELNLGLVNGAEYTTVTVTLSQDASTFFSRIIFRNPIRVAAHAEAIVETDGGRFCILALEDEADDAIRTQGNVTIDAPDCGLASNSLSDSAMSVSGNVTINVGTIRVSGDISVSGGAADLTYSSLQTGKNPLEDPFSNLEVPESGDCDETNYSTTRSVTLSPGTYCGGIQISGNNDIEFEPGVYIIDGGDFDVSGRGEMIGEGVTFILTGSEGNYAELDISGNRSINFSAPEEGEDWEGIVFFQDPDAPEGNNAENKITGTNDIIFNGVAYFPSQELWFGGDTRLLGSETVCTKLIAKAVTFAGNPALGNECNGFGVPSFGDPSVTLSR